MKNEISLAFDFLDPWGWVAERRLMLAMRKAGVDAPITYLPCRTSLSRRSVGRHFADYQQLRFGSQAKIHENRLIAEASSLGLTLGLLNVQKIPDPWFAMIALRNEHRHPSALFNAIYAAIFRDGHDIGNVDVLAELLRSESAETTVPVLLSSRGLAGEVIKCEQEVALWSHNLTPCIRIGEAIVTGAQPPSILERLLLRPAPATAMTSNGACISDKSCVTRNIVER